ncbi:MAG: DUF502 domain-containing protein [Bacteroidia bacterium]|jgi:uncharacterized membrane protein|nr:DUF502 domain-containing protein [Bacteroidia bacterium]
MVKTSRSFKAIVKAKLAKLINYFLKGLLVVLPFAITFSIIRSVVVWLDTMFDVGIPAVGFLIVIVSIIVLGWLGSSIFTQTLLNFLDDILGRIPFVKIIYTSVKDFMEAFVGDKKKFNNPVLVQLGDGILKPGFITQDDLTSLNLPGMVAVYCPHSYAFSGNLFFVTKDKVRPLDGNPTEVMKYIVSGGVTAID